MAGRLEKLYQRRSDPAILVKALDEVYAKIEQSESVKYVVGSMQPIDPQYTKNTYAQADRVINQLKQRLGIDCDYEFQGSVTNDTHIKAHSDIDVLVIVQKFFGLEQPQKATNPYQGDPVQDLMDLRLAAIKGLVSAFPEAKVDSTGSKSISIQGGSLSRKIDVVPSNWFNTNMYVETKDKMYRAVQILDAKKKERLKNTPFLHNAWIEHKDSQTNGGLRKAARLLKSLKYDSDSINLSSYDIVSLAFNIPDVDLKVDADRDLMILNTCQVFCRNLLNNQSQIDSLMVPDDHRKIFGEGHATKQGLDQLCKELDLLVRDVLNENTRSFSKLAEARVRY